MHLLSEIPTDVDDFPVREYAKPRDPLYRRSDNTAGYSGCRFIRSIAAGYHTYDPLGIDWPPDGWPHPRPTHLEIVAGLRGER